MIEIIRINAKLLVVNFSWNLASSPHPKLLTSQINAKAMKSRELVEGFLSFFEPFKRYDLIFKIFFFQEPSLLLLMTRYDSLHWLIALKNILWIL